MLTRQHAPDIKADNLNAFLGYAETCVMLLGDHHRQEDDLVLPKLYSDASAATDKEKLAQQHAGLAQVIEKLAAFLNATRSRPAQWKPEEFLSLLSSLTVFSLFIGGSDGDKKTELNAHLAAEEATWTDAMLRQNFPHEDDLRQVGRAIGQRAQTERAKTLTVPFFRLHLTADEQLLLWRRVPSFVRSFIFPLYSLRHYSYWQFASID